MIGRMLVAALLVATWSLPAAAQLTPDAEKALYEAAKAEGSVNWYVAHYSTEIAERYGRAFTEKYPGVKVNVVRATSGVVFQRVVQELRSGPPQADVLASADISHYLELKRRGQLETYRPANSATLIEPMRRIDPDDQYHAVSFGLVVLMRRTDKVKAEDAPKAWTDLHDPRWRNQIALSHPSFSGSVTTWTAALNKAYGWSFFEKLEKNKPQIGRSLLDTNAMLKAGERTVGMALLQAAAQDQDKGEPIAPIYPTDGGVVIAGSMAIVKGAPHPNAAKLFMEYLQGEAFDRLQSQDFFEPMHEGVPSRTGLVLKNTKLLIISPEELLKAAPEVKDKWRDTFGN
ncbi:MAG: extracellular solute-binding protein [Alphaproteobacteria bacterium]|nr:extracellular solute-binding protein [Alphaproteobacteria bacterium]